MVNKKRKKSQLWLDLIIKDIWQKYFNNQCLNENENFLPSSRKVKILTTGIHEYSRLLFRGIKIVN
jgi:hypothetical protein